MVRASALRSKVFILAKACSIGLRSGERRAGRRACFGRADGGANGAALMAAEVVHDDNIAGREDRDENLLDISAEAHAIDRSVDDAGRGEAVATQRRQEREGSPSPEGRFGDEAFASGHRPWARVMLVLAQVSSMKTSRLGSILA